jgi:hypothetical protein
MRSQSSVWPDEAERSDRKSLIPAEESEDHVWHNLKESLNHPVRVRKDRVAATPVSFPLLTLGSSNI